MRVSVRCYQFHLDAGVSCQCSHAAGSGRGTLGGAAYATSNYCSHLACLLSSGKVVEDGLGCSCHGSVFDLETGEPILPPATEPIQTYPVKEENGEIFVGIELRD